MSACVLDASMTGAWLFAEARTEAVVTLFRGFREDRPVVPALWHTETANLLLVAERRGRISAAGSAALLDLLGELAVETDEVPTRAYGPLLDLARTHRLTTYDATYLDLARRRRLPLATRDADLVRAAQALGHPVIGG